MNQSIIVVEDDVDQAKDLGDSLRAAGWRVTPFNDAEKAFECLQSSRHDMLLLDIKMPGKDGYWLLDLARERGTQLPMVVVLSAFVESDLEWERLSGCGVHAILRKPIRHDTLPGLLAAIQRGDQSALAGFKDKQAFFSRESTISAVVKRREETLRTYFRQQAGRSRCRVETEPLLVVARRWNSWYPSYFNVSGGAYAIVGEPP